MKLFYTTSTFTNDTQNKHELSLGGFKSKSEIPNDFEGNLFSRLSLLTIEKCLDEYIGIVIQNDLTVSINDLTIWFEYNDDFVTKFEISPVSLTNGSFERIQSRFSKPIVSEFYDVSGQENGINVGNLSSEECIGLWIKRTILKDKIKEQQTTAYLNANFGLEEILKETINLKFDYQLSYGDSIGSNNI